MQITGINGANPYQPISPRKSATAMRDSSKPIFGSMTSTIYTRTPANRTDDAIRNDIIELAKKDARRGTHGRDTDGRGTKSKEFDQLLGEYVTSVSPDRRTIYPAATAQLGKAVSMVMEMPVIDYSILDLWIFGTKVSLENTSVVYHKSDKTTEINHVEFTMGGEPIGSYDKNSGWAFSLTEAEHSRYEELNLLYLDAWNAETKLMDTEK